MNLVNKKIVITGGADGLGLALSRALVARGAQVCILSRDQQKIDTAIKELGEKAQGFAVDVSQWQTLSEVANTIGSVDVLINNAGVWIEGSLLDHDVVAIERAIDSNLKGVIFATKAFLPTLSKASESHIINISSTSGLKGRNGQAVYAATKFGVQGFTESLKLDLEKTNIKVTGFYPGGMNTQLFAKAGTPKDNQDWMDTAKVAEILVFMLERDLSMVMDHVVLNKRQTKTSN